MILIGGLFNVQVIKGAHYYKQSENNRIRLIELLAPRGNVYDVNGALLIGNRASYNVTILPQDFSKEDLPRLSKILNISEEDIRAKIKKAKRVPFMPAILKRDIDQETLFVLEESKPDFGGVLIETQAVRYYPHGAIASHVLGYVGRISQSELDRDDHGVYSRNDLIGRSGVEKGLDSILRGENGGRQIEVDSRGRLSSVISERKPKKGQDVYLTIDIALQKKLEVLLADRTGTIGMMDPNSGEVIAWVSHPSYDPNAFIDSNRSKERISYLKNKTLPMLDRGLMSLYPPGSVFKVVTILTAFDRGKLNNKTTFFCNGFFKLNPRSRPFKCWFHLGHGPVNVYKAIERSCNVFLYNLGRMLKPEELKEMSMRVGLGEEMNLELSYRKGLIPDEDWKKKIYKEKWYLGETISYSIGQGFLSVTPMEVMRMMGAIASGYHLPSPHFAKDIFKHPKKKLGINLNDLKSVRQGLYNCVQTDYGTGQYARVSFMKVAGKTGTAQASRGEDHAWFSGYFPYQKPEVSFVIFIEHGKSGGGTAAKLGHEVLWAWKINKQEKVEVKKSAVSGSEKLTATISPLQTNPTTVVHAA